jgi:hypothetical protein
MELTASFVDLIQHFTPVFTTPTFQTFVKIITGWAPSHRRRFVTEVIFAGGNLRKGHWCRFRAESRDERRETGCRTSRRARRSTGHSDGDRALRERFSGYGSGVHKTLPMAALAPTTGNLTAPHHVI